MATARDSNRLSADAQTLISRLSPLIDTELRTPLIPLESPDGDFASAGTHRVAVTGLEPASPIRYLVPATQGMDLSTTLGLYFHEVGHHLGELDEPTRKLDRWSADWVQALQVRSESLAIFGGEGLFLESLTLESLDQSVPWSWTPQTLTAMGTHLFLRDAHTAIDLRALALKDPAYQGRQIVGAQFRFEKARWEDSTSELVIAMRSSVMAIPGSASAQEAIVRVPARKNSSGALELDFTRSPSFVLGGVFDPAVPAEDLEWERIRTQQLARFRWMSENKVTPLLLQIKAPPKIVLSYSGKKQLRFEASWRMTEEVKQLNANVVLVSPSGLPSDSEVGIDIVSMIHAEDAEEARREINASWCEPATPEGRQCHLKIDYDLPENLPKFIEVLEVRVWINNRRLPGYSAQSRLPARYTFDPTEVTVVPEKVIDVKWLKVCDGVEPGTGVFYGGGFGGGNTGASSEEPPPGACPAGVTAFSVSEMPSLDGGAYVVADPDRFTSPFGVSLEMKHVVRLSRDPEDPNRVVADLLNPWKRVPVFDGPILNVTLYGIIVRPGGVTPAQYWRFSEPLTLTFSRQ